MAGAPKSNLRPRRAVPYRESGTATDEAPPPPTSRPPRPGRRAAPVEPIGAAPARNFTLTAAERVRALVAGPPPWAIRKRRIEDLEKTIVARLVLAARKLGAIPDPWPRQVARLLAELNGLVDAHNRYYPIEANLPCDPLGGGVLEGSTPFRPMEAFTAASLEEKARRRLRGEEDA